MLEPKEWKQLIDHELSETAWRYIPVIGAGFLPYAGLAQISHSGPAARGATRPTHKPGPAHAGMQRSRHVTMAEMAAAYEATAHGQAGEEYGIRVLPLDTPDLQPIQGVPGDGHREPAPVVHRSDTEETTLGPAENDMREGGYRHGYLEGSFGRLNVEDSLRLRNAYRP